MSSNFIKPAGFDVHVQVYFAVNLVVITFQILQYSFGFKHIYKTAGPSGLTYLVQGTRVGF